MSYDPNRLPVGASDASEYWNPAREKIEGLLASDPDAAAVADRMREIAERNPGVVAAALIRLEDEVVLSDSRTQRSLKQAAAGEATPLTESDLDHIS